MDSIGSVKVKVKHKMTSTTDMIYTFKWKSNNGHDSTLSTRHPQACQGQELEGQSRLDTFCRAIVYPIKVNRFTYNK